MQNLNKTKPIQIRYIHLKRKLKTYFNAKLIGIGHQANCQCFYFGLGLPFFGSTSTKDAHGGGKGMRGGKSGPSLQNFQKTS
jgi:hypothetical protein